MVGCDRPLENNDQTLAADIAYQHGKIYTLNPEQPWAEALAIRDGRLVFVGSTAASTEWLDTETEVVDLESKFVMPGIQDAHIHTQMAAEFLLNLNTDPHRPWPDIAQDIQQYAQDNPEKEWILGGNLPWLTDTIGDSDVLAHRSTLDELVPNHAIALWDIGGHAMLANSKALELVGIEDETPDPTGGTIERDESGRATGILRELATNLVTENATALTELQMAEGLEQSIANLSRLGITAFHETWTYPTTLRALKLLADEGRLHARVTVAIAHPVEFVTADAKRAANDMIDNRAEYESERLQIKYAKFVLDGSAGGQTLVLTEPYIGTDYRGELRNPEAEVMAEVSRLESLGIGSVLHGVGDGAIRLALNAIEKSRRENPGSGVRQILSHTVFVNPVDINRIKALDVIAEFSPYFWFPNEGADILLHELGQQRLNWAFPMRAIVDAGNHVAAGSDWPVIFDPNPFPAIETMITRQKPGGSELAFGKEHAITLAEALAMFTTGGAYAHHLETSTGSLEVGKLADFVVLDQDLFAIPVTSIHQTQVVKTVLEGEVIYQAQ